MKIQYCSDLHLELERNSAFLERHPLKTSGDVLLIAGDLSPLDLDFYRHPFFDDVSRRYEVVFIVPGNHEFYNGPDASVLEAPLRREIRRNVFLVDKVRETLGTTTFVFTTLWSRIRPEKRVAVELGVSDFYAIRRYGRLLDTDGYNTMHESSLAFLREALSAGRSGKTVVVTHHLPSPSCVHPDFRDNPLGDAFVADLDGFIEERRPDYWIYGHSHRNLEPITIGGTTLLTNQLGYVQARENHGFEADACFGT